MEFKIKTTEEIVPQTDPKPTVELVGQDGNAFAIIGRCNKAARKAGWTPKQVKALNDEMIAGDYNHVLQVAMTFFEEESCVDDDDYDLYDDDEGFEDDCDFGGWDD